MHEPMNLRRLLAVLLAVVLAGSLTGCGEPADSEPSIGQVERTETVVAQGLALVTEGDGVARLVGTLLNEAELADQLVGVDVDTEIGPYSIIIADRPLVLRHDKPFRLARDGVVTVISNRLRKGFRVELTLLFRNSAPIVTNVPVESQTGPYADVDVMSPPDGDLAP